MNCFYWLIMSWRTEHDNISILWTIKLCVITLLVVQRNEHVSFLQYNIVQSCYLNFILEQFNFTTFTSKMECFHSEIGIA